MNDSDLSIRSNASFSMINFVRCISNNYNQKKLIEEGNLSLIEHSINNTSSLSINIITNILFPIIKKNLYSKNPVTRQEFLILLSEIITQFPDKYKELIPFLGNDEESNFFFNINHLQIHRRQRAMIKFRSICELKEIKKKTLMSIFYPMFRHMMMENNTKKDHNLIDECVKTIAVLTSYIDWKEYRTILNTFMGIMQRKPELEKSIIKLLVLILDNFHFNIDTSKYEQDEDHLKHQNLITELSQKKFEIKEKEKEKEKEERKKN